MTRAGNSFFQSAFNRVRECYNTLEIGQHRRKAFQSAFNRVRECYVELCAEPQGAQAFQSAFNRVRECYSRCVSLRVYGDSTFSPLLIASGNVTLRQQSIAELKSVAFSPLLIASGNVTSSKDVPLGTGTCFQSAFNRVRECYL